MALPRIEIATGENAESGVKGVRKTLTAPLSKVTKLVLKSLRLESRTPLHRGEGASFQRSLRSGASRMRWRRHDLTMGAAGQAQCLDTELGHVER